MRQAGGRSVGLSPTPELECDHAEKNQAEHALDLGVADAPKSDTANDNPDNDKGKQAPQVRPARVFAEKRDAEHIRAKQ